MSDPLAGLPHQIPFRLVDRVEVVDDEHVNATFLVSANDSLDCGKPSPVLMIEAMAQAAGFLAFQGSSEPGFLSGIEDANFESVPEVGDRVALRISLAGAFGRIFRFEGVAERGGETLATARFYLAAQEKGDSHENA